MRKEAHHLQAGVSKSLADATAEFKNGKDELWSHGFSCSCMSRFWEYVMKDSVQ